MPSAADLTDLLALHDREQARIAAEKAADRILAGAAETPAAAAERVERAAWTMVANVLLNLDETQTKE
jgi:hypothetical protein